jgi:hypothetical protein
MVVAVIVSHQVLPADATSITPYNILTVNGIALRYDPSTPGGALYLAIVKALGL